MEDLIKVTQLPIIEEQLRRKSAEIEAKVSEAKSLACTEETIQAVKDTRAALNKEFEKLEAQRKAVKTAIMAPYEAFEAIYKECISDHYKTADAELKGKINEVETEQKRRCEERLRDYFAELCAVHGVDYVSYEQIGIKIDMASAKAKKPQKLFDRIGEFVAGVAVGADQIAVMDDAAEIMTEYKSCLNVGKAVATVQERKRRIEAERAAAEKRAEAQEQQREAVARVEAAAPPTVTERKETEENDKKYRCTFTVFATKNQLKSLKSFMISEGINYERA